MQFWRSICTWILLNFKWPIVSWMIRIELLCMTMCKTIRADQQSPRS